MKFGPVATAGAKGALLAHSLTVGTKRFKKGRVLSQDDVAQLLEAGLDSVTVARLDAGDVVEDEAAHRLATALVAHGKGGIWSAEPFTGRVNLYARHKGLFKADRALVDRLNRIDPAITFATLADDSFVEAGRMVATVKIIPFAVDRASLDRAEAVASGDPLVVLHPVTVRRVAHVSTALPSLKTSVMDKTRRTLEARMDALGCTLIPEQRVAHSVEAVRESLRAIDADCDLIILFGASAITDPEDVLPAALRAAGGTVHQLGMPVDPGNLLLVGELAGKPVIGAPGCARSPAENGFDWVLHRLACAVAVDPHYVTGLGVGGLLMEINSRPQPRDPEAIGSTAKEPDGDR